MTRKNKAAAILLILIFAVFFCLAYFVYATLGQLGGHIYLNQVFYSLGQLSGLTGFLFLSIIIISGDTARFFDRFFGMDKIIKFQRKFATIVFIFVLFHPIFFMLANKSISNFLVPNFLSVPLSVGIISFYLFIAVSIASKIYKRISHIIWQYIHILTYLLFFSALYHAVNLGYHYYLLPIKTIYALLLILIIIGIIYRTWYKIINRKLIFVVKEIKRETEDTFTLSLRSNKKFNFKAGQFCFLRLDRKKLYARHPFTISSAPQDNDVCFTIKLKGRFTKEAAELKTGERVIVEGPFGIFNIEDKKKNLVFIAGGVGIAPFMSIIRDKINNKDFQDVLLLYGVKTKNDLIFRDDLERIREKWFQKVYVLNDDSFYSGPCEKGYVDEKIIKKYVGNPENSIFYICGPEPMKEMCKKALFDIGVRKNNIIVESFFW